MTHICPACGQPINADPGLQFPFKRRVLWKGHQLPIVGNVALILFLLHDNLGDLVTYQQIIEFVWPKQPPHHFKDVLRRNVNTIRQCLVDHDIPYRIVKVEREGHVLLPRKLEDGSTE